MPETAVPPYPSSYLMPALAHATVADAMHPGILSCPTDATPRDVARLMAMHHVHCVAVMHPPQDGVGEPYVWGIVSDLDLLRAEILAAAGQDSAGTLSQQPTISVKPTIALRDAAELMLRHGVSHLVVVDPETRRPVGVLSTLDVAGVLAWGEG